MLLSAWLIKLSLLSSEQLSVFIFFFTHKGVTDGLHLLLQLFNLSLVIGLHLVDFELVLLANNLFEAAVLPTLTLIDLLSEEVCLRVKHLLVLKSLRLEHL